MVVPLYVLLLRQYGQQSGADAIIARFDDEHDTIDRRLESIDSHLQDVRTDVEVNGHQITENQQHIHELLVHQLNTDTDAASDHHHDDCSFSEDCPFTSGTDS